MKAHPHISDQMWKNKVLVKSEWRHRLRVITSSLPEVFHITAFLLSALPDEKRSKFRPTAAPATLLRRTLRSCIRSPSSLPTHSAKPAVEAFRPPLPPRRTSPSQKRTHADAHKSPERITQGNAKRGSLEREKQTMRGEGTHFPKIWPTRQSGRKNPEGVPRRRG